MKKYIILILAILLILSCGRRDRIEEEFGIREEDIAGLAEGVMKVTRLLANNPRKMTFEDAERIYKAAL